MTNLYDYYQLAKPRMVYGNTLVAAAAFVFGTQGAIHWPLLAATLAGLACVMASACVLNNYYDRHIDAKMERTKGRAMPAGRVAPLGAVIFGLVLLALGLKLLLLFTNLLAPAAALAGWVVYVLAYTPLKTKTPYALFVGALAGATPPLVGYAAAAGTLDAAAAWLFVFLFVWQVPHFLAISVYRHEEYAQAGVPLFMRGPYTPAQKLLGRRVFYLSLVVLLAWCALLVIVHR